MKKNICVVAAGSDIGRAICHYYAAKGFGLVLTTRNLEQTKQDAADYELRYRIQTTIVELDLSDFWSHKSILEPLLPHCDGLIMVAGYLGDNVLALEDWDECQKIIDSNYSGCLSIVNIAAQVFRARNDGFIVGISSVAGDRGRASNFFYGSAKAGFTTYLSGLRGLLRTDNVHVLTVKPGFVNTKMTAGLALPKLLVTSPENVAKAVYNGVRRRKDVIYVSGIWWLIMSIIKSLPGFVFNRMKI